MLIASSIFTLLMSLTAPTSSGAAVPVPDPIILTCNIPEDLCATLEADCVAAGTDPNRCLELAMAVCPADKCLACDRAVDACEADGGDCTDLADHCDDALLGCACDQTQCRDTESLSLPELFAVCFAFPSMLAHGECSLPSAGQCFAALAWEGCNLDTCQYEECMRDIETAGECTASLPDSCKPVVACIEAEETGTIPGPIITPSCALIDDIVDPEAFCKANPWGRASECGGDGPTPEACLESLESMLGCDVSACDFAECAASFAITACGERPRGCDGVAMCD